MQPKLALWRNRVKKNENYKKAYISVSEYSQQPNKIKNKTENCKTPLSFLIYGFTKQSANTERERLPRRHHWQDSQRRSQRSKWRIDAIWVCLRAKSQTKTALAPRSSLLSFPFQHTHTHRFTDSFPPIRYGYRSKRPNQWKRWLLSLIKESKNTNLAFGAFACWHSHTKTEIEKGRERLSKRKLVSVWFH